MEEIPARLGSDVDLYCRLSGTAPIRWERPDGRPLNQARQYPGGLLRIQNVQPQDGGVYSCVRGEQTQYVRLEVSQGKTKINLGLLGSCINCAFVVIWFWVIFD